MHSIIDLDTYALDRPHTTAWSRLVTDCKDKLAVHGLFNLPGFIRDEAIAKAVTEVKPTLDAMGFIHARRHNIYFSEDIAGLEPKHPALQKFETANCTICADKMGPAVVIRLYEWGPFATFLAAVMEKPKLYMMDDPLARVNVMSYSNGQAVNWHFDRSEFTTTILLQAPLGGGQFEYDKDLRSDNDPNYDGVADLLEGRRSPTRMRLNSGTLNVFKGKNTAHRVTPVIGSKDRIIAVFSFYECPGVLFSEEERVGFYGRAL